MGIKEITREMVYSFFVIFSGSVLAMYVYLLIFGQNTVDIHHITALLVMTVLADLASFVFYSRKDLSKKQMFVRYVIHLAVIIGIMLSAATYLEWVRWHEPVQIIVFVGLVVAVYTMVMIIDEYQNKKLADKLNQKLKERYKE